jgi:hypothetical protein
MVPSNLDAFSDRNDLVFVIDRFNYIEEELDRIIAKHINSPKESANFVKDIMLNNSIISFSSKVKLFMHLRAINSWPSIAPDDFYRFMNIRNQFAHCNLKTHVQVNVITDGQEEKSDVSVKLMLESVTNAVAFNEFKEIYVRLKDYFNKLPITA